MIYTVTFNPSLDYIVTVDNFKTGITNRTASEALFPGGKGINVSIMLSEFGIDNSAVYFSAGFVGDEITKRIRAAGIHSEAILVKEGCSRINLKLKSIDGTEINGAGPVIREEEIEKLKKKLEVLTEDDYLVLSGSVPSSVPDTIYADLCQMLLERGVRIIVDAAGNLLLNTLKYRPFLIKPNKQELEELFKTEISTKESALFYAKKLQDMGAKNVLVSLGKEGAVFVSEDGKEYAKNAPKGKLINGVGAGDSMVAGFLYGYIEKRDSEEAFRFGLSAGSASAFCEYFASKDDVISIYESLE